MRRALHAAKGVRATSLRLGRVVRRSKGKLLAVGIDRLLRGVSVKKRRRPMGSLVIVTRGHGGDGGLRVYVRVGVCVHGIDRVGRAVCLRAHHHNRIAVIGTRTRVKHVIPLGSHSI